MEKKKTSSASQLNNGIPQKHNIPEIILDINAEPETILEVEEESETLLEVEEGENTILEVDDESETILKTLKTSKDVIPILAGWCGRCGYHYGENNSTDVYCPRCGMKRETLK